MRGSFFSGFWKRGGTRGECYFRKMHGRRCWNGKLFFHRLREVNGIYIFRRWGFVLYIFQRICFCGFLFIFCYHETTGYSTLDFFLSSYLTFFFSIFSSTSKRHFSPFFSSSPLLPESSVFPLFHILLLTECFLSFFCRISWFYLFIYFYLFV